MMLRTAFLGLGLAAILAQASAATPTDQPGQVDTQTFAGARSNRRVPGSHVSFTLSPELPYILGIAGMMGVAYMILTRRPSDSLD